MSSRISSSVTGSNERGVDHQKWQRSVAHMSASPGPHGYGHSCRRNSHKTDRADRNGGCLMGEGRCWTCPTVRWTQEELESIFSQ